MISQKWLLKRLIRTAQLWSLLTMASVVVFGVIAGLAPLPEGGKVAILFGGPLLLSSWLEKTMCRKMVTCPDCGGSLWELGTGNFKPRRMKLKPGIKECPHCQTRILSAG